MTLRQLDRSRPYGVITGLLGARFEQDNFLFNSAGSEVAPENTIEDIQPEIQPDIEDAVDIKPAAVAETRPEKEIKSFEDMHWKHLKPLVESYGGEWTTKDDAIKFLRGR